MACTLGFAGGRAAWSSSSGSSNSGSYEASDFVSSSWEFVPACDSEGGGRTGTNGRTATTAT